MTFPERKPLVPKATQIKWLFSANTVTPKFAWHLPKKALLIDFRFTDFFTLSEDEILLHVKARGWPPFTVRTITEIPKTESLAQYPTFLVVNPEIAHCHRLYLNSQELVEQERSLVFATQDALNAYIVRSLIYRLHEGWIRVWREAKPQ